MLPTTYLGDFLPYVIPHCSSCPDAVALHMLRRAAIRFCETTKTWRHTIQQSVAANSPVVAAPALTQIHSIEAATFDGVPLTPVAFVAADPEQITGRVAVGRPEMITQSGLDSVQIEPFRAGELRLSLILKPRTGRQLAGDPANPLRDALDVVPPYLLDKHVDTIAAGALGHILMLPGQPFTNPQKAGMFADEFAAACAAAQPTASMGQQRAPLRTKPSYI